MPKKPTHWWRKTKNEKRLTAHPAKNRSKPQQKDADNLHYLFPIGTLEPKPKSVKGQGRALHVTFRQGDRFYSVTLEDADLIDAFNEVRRKRGVYSDATNMKHLMLEVQILRQCYGVRIMQHVSRHHGNPVYQYWLLDRVHCLVEFYKEVA